MNPNQWVSWDSAEMFQLCVISACVDVLLCGFVLFYKYTSAQFADMEWQTPAVSEKFQSRFGRRPGTSDSGDTGLGTSASDSAEGDFCLFSL